MIRQQEKKFFLGGFLSKISIENLTMENAVGEAIDASKTIATNDPGTSLTSGKISDFLADSGKTPKNSEIKTPQAQNLSSSTPIRYNRQNSSRNSKARAKKNSSTPSDCDESSSGTATLEKRKSTTTSSSSPTDISPRKNGRPQEKSSSPSLTSYMDNSAQKFQTLHLPVSRILSSWATCPKTVFRC